jgi:hypothetical protein
VNKASTYSPTNYILARFTILVKCSLFLQMTLANSLDLIRLKDMWIKERQNFLIP